MALPDSTSRKPARLPALVPLPQVKAVFGFSRSTAYRLATEGRIKLKKLGGATYIEAESALDLIASLPEVQLAGAGEEASS